MVPGVDGTLAESPHQMEQTGGRWRSSSRIPEFVRPGTGSPSGGTSTHSRPQRRLQGDGGQTRSTTTTGHGLAKEVDKEKERSANGKKMVTMAPVSRCMSSKGQYVARRPLMSTERHTSILKNTLSHEITTQDKNQTGSTGNTLLHNERTFHFSHGTKDSLTCPSPSKSYGLSLSPSPSMSREDLSLNSPLTTADLRTWSEEPIPRSKTSLAKNHSHSHSSRRSLSSPPLDVYSLGVPASPNFTSTQRKSYVPSSSSTSPPRLSRKTVKADSLLRDTTLKPVGSTFVSKVSPPPFSQMSPYQANYWTCAIPTSLPPSPDRSSPSWDPNKEYEDLLDYTYPLRPGYNAHTAASGHKWGSTPGLDSSRYQPKTAEVILEDSGIELDRFCSSSTLSCLDQSAGVSRSWSKGGNLNPHSKQLHRSLGLQGLGSRELSQSKSSDGRLSSSLYSVDHIGLSVESLESDVKGQAPGQRGSLHYKNQGVYSTSRRSPTTFIPTLRVMPRPGLLGDLDEEFLALPHQLYEIQVLSQHLKDISTQVCQLPVTTSWESLEREREGDNSSNQSIETVTAMQEDEEEEMEEQEEEEEDREGSVLRGHPRIEEPSEEVRVFESALHMLTGEVNRASVKEVASIMDRLGGVSLSESEDQTKESLTHHIQAFCGNLQELIQWLYTVVHKMESLTPPSVDIESVKTSLADYKSFQRDVHAHRPLTGAVLHTGDKLLHCMNSTSPVLKETLVMIERQSQALETHAEHLFSSILSAMDSLAEASSREGTECSDQEGIGSPGDGFL